jgi:hypothetical protein
MDKFNKAAVKGISEDIVKALKVIEDKYGITIERGSARYSELEFKLDLNIKVGDTEALENEEKRNFELMAKMYGFNPEGYNKPFKNGGTIMRVVGFNTKAPKYPISLLAENGSRYKISVEAYKHHFPNTK